MLPFALYAQKMKAVDVVWVEGGVLTSGLSHETLLKINELYPGWAEDPTSFWPTKEIRIQGFYLQKHEVTNEEFCKFLNNTDVEIVRNYFCQGCPGDLCKRELKIECRDGQCEVEKGYEKHPVVCIQWKLAQAYCEWIGGRLPTYYEMEYAIKEGKYKSEYLFSGSDDLDEVAIHKTKEPAGVMSKKPNRLGIYDLTGNVSEWTSTNVDTIKQIGRWKKRFRRELLRTIGGSFHPIQDQFLITNLFYGGKPPDAITPSLGFRVCFSE